MIKMGPIWYGKDELPAHRGRCVRRSVTAFEPYHQGVKIQAR